MQVVLIILSVALLGLIIYFAVSSKSSRLLRLSALGALGLIGLSLGIASIFIFLNGNDEAEEARLPIFLDIPQEPADSGNQVEIIVFLVVLSAIIGLIAVIAYKDHKKRLAEAKKAVPSALFPLDDHHDDLELKVEEPPAKPKDDDPFNLELD